MVILSEIEQGSSSSSHSHDHNNNNSNHKQQRYDVFLSFRGSDTRNNFTDHLYNALTDADISTFLDDEEIETGEDLKPELEDAIRSSRASVIVLSKNYATSTWCLDELALILDQRLTADQIVIPIFYHVEPTDVRKQQNSFGDAMAEHRKKKITNAEKMDRWIKALTDVADLKGKDVKGRKEVEFIEEIVTEIRQRLGVPLSGTLPLLIGRYGEIEEITSWLTDGSSSYTADILTVSGMGGIGKTSLAKYVFHLHSRTFDKCSFVEGVNLRCTGNYNGLLDVQKQLCGDISKKNKLPVHDTCVYTSMIEKALARVKVFLVLDDIDSLDQLDALLGNKGFHPGSKIIITTRNTSLTERCALFKSEIECKHTTLKVEGLSIYAAPELLCLHAFKCKDPKEGYEVEVIKKLVKYCEGHPLALKVLGSSLHNKDIAYWNNFITKLTKESHGDIRKVLQMSFDSLQSENDKELFKHIACFFNGMDREVSEQILEACNIYAISGIPNLIERCLLSIGWGNRLMMHQLLQEMGKAIVREESPGVPGKRSRLWCHDESFVVLKKKKGTETLKGLVFDPRLLEKEKFHEPWHLKTDAFSNMDNLMILQLNNVQLDGSYEDFPEELRWLRLHGYPLKSIPSDIPMEKLVVLDMSYSKIESFAACCTSCNPGPIEGGQKLIGSCSKDKISFGSLKILDLSFCEHLHKLCGFYELPTLERLIASNCKRLIEICESLEECVELVHIDLSYCVKLERLPTAIHKLKKDYKLLLDGCNIRESILQQLVYSAISFPSSLVELSLANCSLSNESFPVDLSCLSSLEYLCLDGNPIVSMPNCVRSLCSLEELSMVNCKFLTSIEPPPCTLKWLTIWMFRERSLLARISFDPDMSPIRILELNIFRGWSYEIEGMVKIQPLEGIKEKLLSTLGWTHLLDDLLIKRQVVGYADYKGLQKFQIQMYYEFGIFSTVYGGQSAKLPKCSRSIRRKTPSISFTIPSSPHKQQLRGLNFCYMERLYDGPKLFQLPIIEINNVAKNRTWIYKHCIWNIHVLGGKWVTYLSHWMFGMNEMEPGDLIIITIIKYTWNYEMWASQLTMKCGVGFVYEEDEEEKEGDDDGSMEDDDGSMDNDDENMEDYDGSMEDDGYTNIFDQPTTNCEVSVVYEEDEDESTEEDALGYYKSWNHIIGGDLSSFQTTTGEYFLSRHGFEREDNESPPIPLGKYDIIRYKEETVPFRAFSKRKSPKPPPNNAERQRLSD